MTMMLSLISVVLVLFAFGYFKLRQASREIDRLFKTNTDLQSELLQQKAKVQQKEMELFNAKVKRKSDEIVKRASDGAVDVQLHEKGYFRDHSDGVSGVQSDLSESGRHDGNETPSACSQSDF